MKNNLTEKDIENLNKWAEKYNIEELKIKDKEKIFNLEELHITSHNLTELPKEIGILTNLKRLDIRTNNFTKLPKEIGNLINLEKLYIDCNNLEISPDGIEKLINLENLHIEINIINKDFNFKSLPIEEIGKLNNLKDLSILIRKWEK
mgnify:CR=1 FL=1